MNTQFGSLWLLGIGLALVACSPQSTTTAPDPLASQVEAVMTAEIIPAELAGSDIRPEVGGLYGAVVSEHPLASQAGYEVLKAGGNAVDAAVTMAGVLAVVRPHMNGIGGDMLSLFYEADTGEVTALNASGRAGALATPEYYSAQGMERMPFTGVGTVTVPGAVAGWEAALERYGTLTLAQALAPAIRIAEEGFMVSATLAEDLHSSSARLNPYGQSIYRPDGEPLKAGDLLKSTDLAASLQRIATAGSRVMYEGELGAAVAAFLASENGMQTPADFSAHQVDWVTPVSMEFQGRTLHTMPPNSQGIVMLQMMAMAETLPLAQRSANSVQLLHELVEITRIAFADRDRWVADPLMAEVPVQQLINREYLVQRAGLIGETAGGARLPGFGNEAFEGEWPKPETGGDTVYLMVVDREGNAVSWIQSLFGTFGSNLVVPGTGIVLHNRGAGFTLEAGHPNQVAPGKRPMHTLMNTLVTAADGSFEVAVGTPGGGGQPQFITQALLKNLVFGMSPQQAVESPRFRIDDDVGLELESRLPAEVISGLRALGHDISLTDGWTANFGSVQMIQRLPGGMLRTGADMRREAAAMAY